MSQSASQARTMYPPLPNAKPLASPKSPRPPRLARDNPLTRVSSSKSPSLKGALRGSSRQQKQREKQLNHSKPYITKNQLESSFANSQTNLASVYRGVPFEDSQETIIEKGKYTSQGFNFRAHKTGEDFLKEEVSPAFDILSGGNCSREMNNSREIKRSRSGIDKGEDYYLYWKTKAHEYLQTNMKLMEDTRLMTRENSDLKARLDKAGVKATQAKEQPRTNAEEALEKELRAVNLHYLTKIEVMEKELKKKEITIQSYQEKIVQLNNRLSGDGERVKLMDKMKQDIQLLQRKRDEGESRPREEDYRSKGESRSKEGRSKQLGSARYPPTLNLNSPAKEGLVSWRTASTAGK